jgi:hypothetical protein
MDIGITPSRYDHLPSDLPILATDALTKAIIGLSATVLAIVGFGSHSRPMSVSASLTPGRWRCSVICDLVVD